MSAWKPTFTWNKDGKTMTDTKDPLEYLKRISLCVGFLDGSPDAAASARRDIDSCIAAWEKERAFMARWYNCTPQQWRDHYHTLTNLRTAVEKVRDELKERAEYAEDVFPGWLDKQADALDAALRGDA